MKWIEAMKCFPVVLAFPISPFPLLPKSPCATPPRRRSGNIAGCGKMFWVLPGERTQSFCTTHECGEAHHQKTRDEGVRRGLAQPVGTKRDHLAAFLEGEEHRRV